MTVNVYDDVNRLEATFRQTEEFSQLKEAVEAVKADAGALELFKKFREVQMQMQEKQMQGLEIGEEELAEAETVAQSAQEDERIMHMLQSEMKLSGLLEEINGVLMKPVQEIYEEL